MKKGSLSQRLTEFWYDDVRRYRAGKVIGLIIRMLLTVVIACLMWILLSLPGESEHQFFLAAGILLIAAVLTAVNIMWFKNR